MKAISVDNVSKRFLLRSDDGLGSIFKKNRNIFWALKDVSFDVEQGEAVGIIGHNGAGKSTTLKLLTKILEPTNGKIRTRGRVSALIEVGAGFHPEMTGRENIYLNGSILGMTRAEIDKKFDSIVEFAELPRFIDTPVKRYSSGMYARLGFAVAAHVEPEILLVDEVLSVGDERFQVKCQERMRDLMQSGATVMFVSHNYRAVMAMCPRTLVIHRGECAFDGDSAEAVRVAREVNAPDVQINEDSKEMNIPVMVKNARVLDDQGAEPDCLSVGAPVYIELGCVAREPLRNLNFGIEIMSAEGIMAYDINSRMDCWLPSVNAGEFTVRFYIPACNLADGIYYITTGIMDENEQVHYHTWSKCAAFTVRDEMEYRGIARLGHKWSIAEGAEIWHCEENRCRL